MLPLQITIAPSPGNFLLSNLFTGQEMIDELNKLGTTNDILVELDDLPFFLFLFLPSSRQVNQFSLQLLTR